MSGTLAANTSQGDGLLLPKGCFLSPLSSSSIPTPFFALDPGAFQPLFQLIN